MWEPTNPAGTSGNGKPNKVMESLGLVKRSGWRIDSLGLLPMVTYQKVCLSAMNATMNLVATQDIFI